MKSYILLIILLTSTLCFLGAHCDCDSGSADAFVAVDPANYDRNYSSITSVGKRPFGFQKDTWYFNNPSETPPCIKVTGASNRRVEIMVETVPQSRLCVRRGNTEIGCADSGTGRLYSCKRATTNTPAYEFYCDNICEEHDVQFWYRITVGETPEEDPEDHWCDDRSQDEYPEDLLQLPFDYTFPVETTTPLGHAPSTMDHVRHLVLIVAICWLALMITHH